MFDTTMELITQATSNSHFIFCFCNLIIAILLIGSLKPRSYSDQDGSFPFSVVSNLQMNEKETENAEEDLLNANGVSDAEKGMVVFGNQENDSEDNIQEEEEDDDDADADDDNDELRRRAEEFIEKINRGWRAEMLRTDSLIQTENFQTGPRKIHAV